MAYGALEYQMSFIVGGEAIGEVSKKRRASMSGDPEGIQKADEAALGDFLDSIHETP